MGFGQAIGSCFKNYIGFEGRACRSEYWFFVLFAILGGLVTGVLDLVLFPGNQVSPINALFSLALFLPSLAVGARRLHDIDKSGFWLFLWLLPIIGWIILIVWAIKRGDEANNRFGSDPLALAAV